jgi:ABC-type enterobactin transport system permease subunit
MLAETVLSTYLMYGAPSWADLAITEVALSRGFNEANPAMRSRGVRMVAKGVAIPAALTAWDRYLVRKGKKKAAWGFRVLNLGVYGYVTYRNSRLVRAGGR